MGYRGKVVERQKARTLRAEAWTLQEIADEVGASRGTVSVWVRDVDFEPKPRSRARKLGPNKLERAKAAEIEGFRRSGIAEIGSLTDREFLMAGLALYAGDGAKSGGSVKFANSNPELIRLFCRWFRRFFDVDETRLRVRLYLHADLDLLAAVTHWADVTGIPATQFNRTYRAVVHETMRTNRHIYGCCHVAYNSTTEMRRLIGLMQALVSSSVDPG